MKVRVNIESPYVGKKTPSSYARSYYSCLSRFTLFQSNLNNDYNLLMKLFVVNNLDQNSTAENSWAHIRLSAKLQDAVHYSYGCKTVLTVLDSLPTGFDVTIVWTYDVESECRHHLSIVKWNPFFVCFYAVQKICVRRIIKILILTDHWMSSCSNS